MATSRAREGRGTSVSQHVCLSLCLSLCLSVCLSDCMYVCLSALSGLWLDVVFPLCVCVCVCVCVYSSVCGAREREESGLSAERQ